MRVSTWRANALSPLLRKRISHARMHRSRNYRLPWPPSLNRIWRAFGGRVILSLLARDYIARCSNALPTGRVEPLRGRLVVWLHLCAPDNGRKYDIANREKILCDTLTKNRVWLDDEQIDCMVINRGAPAGKGHVDVLIQELD